MRRSGRMRELSDWSVWANSMIHNKKIRHSCSVAVESTFQSERFDLRLASLNNFSKKFSHIKPELKTKNYVQRLIRLKLLA